ncbi:MAG: hypothetical protein M3Y30_07320 [Gemmatimonadota bacterium]|nr:hypothetical protein [Gemmatimonadota bacterium]
MPLVDFSQLPDDARVWVFGSDRPLNDSQRTRLLAIVDDHLARWTAHGAPLTCAREWTENQFLTIGVDQRTEGASGCSIDALFHTLQQLERDLDISLVGGGRVFYRTRNGDVNAVDREEFFGLAERGAISRETPVFDTTVTTLGDWRSRFEGPAAGSWHGQLLPADGR